MSSSIATEKDYNTRYVSPSVQIHPQRFMDEYEYGWDLKEHYSILVSREDKYGINEVLPEESRAESA